VFMAYMQMLQSQTPPSLAMNDMNGMMAQAMAALQNLGTLPAPATPPPTMPQSKKGGRGTNNKGRSNNHPNNNSNSTDDAMNSSMALGMPNMPGMDAASTLVNMITTQHKKKGALGAGATTDSKKPEDPNKAAVDPRKYKTRMCRNWLETGSCPYEHTCCFAHGNEESRSLTDNHKLLASIGYFSNVILLAMTNGQKPALPPHCLYQQPTMFKTPETAEQLKQCSQTLPNGLQFPFQEPLPSAFKGLKEGQKGKKVGEGAGEKKRRRRRGRGRGKSSSGNGADAEDNEEESDGMAYGEDLGA